MSRASLNRWLKPLAILLVIVLIVMLLIPSELSNEQLSQIMPGMTLDQIKSLLGEPCTLGTTKALSNNDNLMSIREWKKEGDWMRPNYIVFIPADTIVYLGKSSIPKSSRWIGKSYLLWVEHNNGVATKTWMFPLKRSGGGFQGCIESIKKYWKQSWK